MTSHAVFLDPSSEHFYEDRLFDVNNKVLNRDGTLVPFARLKEHLNGQGIAVHTADRLRDGSYRQVKNHYWSFGMLDGYKSFVGDDSVRLRGFILLEPPLVQPEMYSELPRLTKDFERVYVHNVYGDGYSLSGVSQDRLHKLNWPQPYGDVLQDYWNKKNRLNKLVVIAGNHNPGNRKPEFYSERIKAIAQLGKLGGIDLYGRGWERWWGRQSRWWPYWRYRRAIMANFLGGCGSKMEVLSDYRFGLCFENMPMKGYITEKIFDCFYAGTVPIYWGAPDIDLFVPAESFVDMRKFSSYEEVYRFLVSLPDAEWNRMREVAREFLVTRGAQDFRDSLLKVVQV